MQSAPISVGRNRTVRHRVAPAMLWLLICAQPVLATGEINRVRETARNEGVVRHVINRCWEENSPIAVRLRQMSAKYIANLSAVTGVPVSDVEVITQKATSEAAARKPLTDEQCKNARAKAVKLFEDRDAKLEGTPKP